MRDGAGEPVETPDANHIEPSLVRVGHGTSIYAYDGDNLVEEVNSSGTAVARYADGTNVDEPLVELRSGTTSYYQADGLGSVTSLSNASGALAQTYT